MTMVQLQTHITGLECRCPYISCMNKIWSQIMLGTSKSSCSFLAVTCRLGCEQRCIDLSLFQVRSTGPVNPMTRQPIKGRKFGGGIRFGEMERDALLAHGAAYLLHDRLHTCSDYTVMEVCSACGSLLSPNQFIPTAAAADMPRAAGGKQPHIAASMPCAMMLYCSMMCFDSAKKDLLHLFAIGSRRICCAGCRASVNGSSVLVNVTPAIHLTALVYWLQAQINMLKLPAEYVRQASTLRKSPFLMCSDF